MIEVPAGDFTTQMSVREAVVRKAYDQARAGNPRAIKMILEITRAIDAEDARDQEEEYLYTVKYLERIKVEEEESLRLNGPGHYHPLPRREDIHVDHRRRKATYLGPVNLDEQFDLDGQEYDRKKARQKRLSE